MNLFQVNLFVRNFEESLAFYRDRLGFEVNDIDPGPPSVPLVNWASLLTGSVIVELFDAAVFGPGGDPGPSEAVELCFIVDDVETERTRLVGHGVQVGDIVEEGWGRYASFRDPDGNRLQIYEVFSTTET